MVKSEGHADSPERPSCTGFKPSINVIIEAKLTRGRYSKFQWTLWQCESCVAVLRVVILFVFRQKDQLPRFLNIE